MTSDLESMTCDICGKAAHFIDRRCRDCFAVENRLESYLKNPAGLAKFMSLLPRPALDDWHETSLHRYEPGWDYEDVLRYNEVTVEWCHELVDGEGTVSEAPPDLCGWGLSWAHGAMHIGQTTEAIAREAAALFVSLWNLGVSASFADKLMDGYMTYLERQENKSLTFLAEVDHYGDARPFLRLTREGWSPKREDFTNIEWKIIEKLAPEADDEIIVTFTKRKRAASPMSGF